MKPNKIIPIRECSCCYEYIDIEKEMFNCPNTKCTYVLCKNCIINLGKKTNSDQCPACRIKLPINYKPLEIISERTPRPNVIIMTRRTNRRTINESSSFEEDCDYICNSFIKFCNDCVKFCCSYIKECSLKYKDKCIIVFQSSILLILWFALMICILIIGHMISVNLYPFIYCCLPFVVSFIIGGAVGVMTLLSIMGCIGGCCKCCATLNNDNNIYETRFVMY
jgi:hypothetical protein|uniref:RING-type domain-containing protein n=1 Tax=viral metagenome TaxID=1070528 RepID=A0A6C0AKS4_9ZZZZ